MSPPDELLDYLEQLGTDETEHTHGSLREHLRGTYALLAGWGASEETCLAGLFHSIYGTEKFKTTTIPLDQRDNVRHRIGDEAERLVYLYAVLLRSSLYTNLERGWPYSLDLRDETSIPIDLDDMVSLTTLDFANRLEQTHGPLNDDHLVTYERAVPLLPAPAVVELRALQARHVPLGRRSRKLARRIPGLRALKSALKN